MAQSAILEALGNDLILERIFQSSDFKRLKELRLVCKCWNTFLCRQLLRRCNNIQFRKPEQWRVYENSIEARRPFPRPGFEEVVEIEPLVCNHWNWIFFGKLCDCSASSKVRTSFRRKAEEDQTAQHTSYYETFLKIPIEVEIHYEYEYVRPGNINSFPFRLVEAKWRSQVVSLSISLQFTVAEVNSMTLFLLHHLTGLKKLEFCYIENQSAPRKTDEDECKVPVLEMAQDTKFGLEYLQYDILEGGFQAYVLDPGFLRHCLELKTFKIKCQLHSNPKMGNDICFNFFNRWNQMVLAEPGAFPRIRFLQFEILSEFGTKAGNYVEFCNSIIDLINLNKPTRLELLGNFDYNFPRLFSKIPCWTHGIQALTMDIPDFIKIDKSRCDEFLRLLNVPKFPQLIRVSLKPFALDQFRLAAVTAVSLKLPIKNQSLVSSRYLRQARTQFPNLTHLNLKFPANYNLKLRFASRDLLFESCKQFTALRVLSLEDYSERNFDTSRPYNPAFQGRFKRLQVVENLQTFKLIVETYEVYVPDVLVFLFQGYQPHVSLDLEVRTKSSYTSMKCQKLTLSVEQFKEALNKAYSSAKRRLRNY